MKPNYIHVCFIIDESGSMYSSAEDVVSGFEKIINDQKSIENGSCSISLYKFNDNINEVYIGKDINDVKPLMIPEGSDSLTKLWSLLFSNESKTKEEDNIEEGNYEIYSPEGCTAMFDGVGTAIDNIGKWLSDMPEEERPSKNLIVIMTDGMENASSKYTKEDIKYKIKHQEEVYSWTFMYMGTDITTREYADSLGISLQSFSDRKNVVNNYEVVNDATKAYRCYNGNSYEASSAMYDYLKAEADSTTKNYMKKVGQF